MQLISTTAVATGVAQRTAQNKQTTTVATVTGTGAVSATVLIEVSNDGAKWITMATIGLSGTTEASDGFGSTVAWPYTRARVTAISGTGATVTASLEG